jgi:transcriptional repressor NrdR
MKCPYCGADDSKVINTNTADGEIRRRRECKSCNTRFTTFERAMMVTPLLVKHDGGREEFDREKLMHSIRLACAKRPVATTEINHLVDIIECTLRQKGCEEIPSRAVGDMVVRGLRELDEIAYVRYALIYLKLHNLNGVLTEIDRLMAVTEN